MDYKKHTQERFFEKLKVIITDDEYNNLCEICNKDENIIIQIPNRNRSYKKIIKFNNNFICCIVSHKKKIIKTIYPISTRRMNKLQHKYEKL